MSEDEEKATTPKKKAKTVRDVASKLNASFYEEDNSANTIRLHQLDRRPLEAISAINEKYFNATRIENETASLLSQVAYADIEKQVHINRKVDRINCLAKNGCYTTPKKISLAEFHAAKMDIKKQIKETAKWSLREKFLDDFKDYEKVINSK